MAHTTPHPETLPVVILPLGPQDPIHRHRRRARLVSVLSHPTAQAEANEVVCLITPEPFLPSACTTTTSQRARAQDTGKIAGLSADLRVAVAKIGGNGLLVGFRFGKTALLGRLPVEAQPGPRDLK